MYHTYFRSGDHFSKVLGSDEFEGTSLVGEESVAITAKSESIERLLIQLERRFSEMDSSVMAATKICDLRNWPLTFVEGITLMQY